MPPSVQQQQQQRQRRACCPAGRLGGWVPSGTARARPARPPTAPIDPPPCFGRAQWLRRPSHTPAARCIPNWLSIDVHEAWVVVGDGCELETCELETVVSWRRSRAGLGSERQQVGAGSTLVGSWSVRLRASGAGLRGWAEVSHPTSLLCRSSAGQRASRDNGATRTAVNSRDRRRRHSTCRFCGCKRHG